jgi:hypothetical protein
MARTPLNDKPLRFARATMYWSTVRTIFTLRMLRARLHNFPHFAGLIRYALITTFMVHQKHKRALNNDTLNQGNPVS